MSGWDSAKIKNPPERSSVGGRLIWVTASFSAFLLPDPLEDMTLRLHGTDAAHKARLGGGRSHCWCQCKDSRGGRQGRNGRERQANASLNPGVVAVWNLLLVPFFVMS